MIWYPEMRSHETTVVRLELTMSSHRNALRAALKIYPELYVVGVKICVYTRNDSESVGTSSRKWNDGRNAFPDPEPCRKRSAICRNESERVPGNGMTVGMRSRIRKRSGIGWNESERVPGNGMTVGMRSRIWKRSGIGWNQSEWVPGNGMTVGMRFRIRNATGNGPESIGMRRNRFPVLAMVGLGRNGLELVSGSGYM